MLNFINILQTPDHTLQKCELMVYEFTVISVKLSLKVQLK